jgi:uncharacterized membrane protein (UPF0182 family)
MEKINKKVMLVAVIIFAVLLSSRSIVNFVTNYLWFKNVDFLNIFTVQVKTKVLMFVPLFIAFTFGFRMYLIRLLKNYATLGKVIYTDLQKKANKRTATIITFIMGAYFAFSITQLMWFRLLTFINQTPFGTADPIFSKDMSFYVFTLPFMNSLLINAITVIGVFIVMTILFYVMMPRIYPPAEGSLYDINEISARPNLNSIFRKDLVRYGLKKVAIFGIFLFLLLGFFFYLKGFYLMYSSRGVAYGASYTDINVTLLGYRVLMVLSLIGSFLTPFGLLKNKKVFMAAIPVLLIVTFLSMNAIALVVQQLVVEPDEITKETQYLEYNIEHTQEGFRINEVENVDFDVKTTLTYEDLLDNAETISNIRINDARPLKQTFNQIQVIRLYYDFNDVDIDRYMIDGEYTQVFISTRELNTSKLIDSAQTWLNMHLKYTHGYGIVMAPVNKVTEEGQPELIFKNVPPLTTSDIKLTRSEIYFGELTDDYIIVNSVEKEFDYPSGSDNAETIYSGSAGIKLGAVNRVLFSIRESSMKLLFSSNITSESRIVINRNIKERVAKLAPFIEFDKNPYIVIDEDTGRLYWIIDGYSVSSNYPYSRTYDFNGRYVNYIRNSVKAVVDAYNGDVSFYVYDEEDPLLKTYQKIYPDIFKDKELMNDALKDHVKYPQDYFNLQGQVYREYHVENPVVFYNGEDVWDVSNEKFMENVQQIESNYVMFELPGEDTAEFSVILPFTPKEKANMASLLVGRCDYENYGKMLIYRFPKDKTVEGPMMIESRIDQDSDISPQFTLWGQEGSSVLRGNVIVVPIEDSLLYVEPIYLQADNKNSIPEMKQVIVAYNNKIVMKTNLEDALLTLFGLDGKPVFEPSDDNSRLQELQIRFNDLKRYVDDLEKIINELIDDDQNK